MKLADALIDLAAVIHASRSVASKHAVLRAQQLDRYRRTSSIAATFTRDQPSKQGQVQKSDSADEAQAVRPAVQKDVEGGVRGPEVTLQQNDALGDETPAGGDSSTASIDEPTSDEKPPEGFDLNIFYTSRGKRLNPYAKDVPRPAQPAAVKPVTDSIDLNVFRTAKGSGLDPTDGRRQTAAMPEVTTAKSFEAKTVTPDVAPVVSTGATQSDSVRTSTDDIQLDEKRAEDETTTREASLMGEASGEMATITPSYQLRESKVPSSRFGRIWNYSGLAAGMFAGAIGESVSRAVGGGSQQGSLMLSPASMERLVTKLSKMRGAALKLGQMMSFQDSKMLPPAISEVLQRVQDKADYMPAWQRDRVLVTNLGLNWRNLFEDFEEKPIAAASIGQVHRATLKSNGAKVAVKIQFPGVADSINSDLDNLSILLSASSLLPKGLYLNKTIDNARTELAWECDYEREAQAAIRYKELLASEQDVYSVPEIYLEASGKQVLTMEFMDGVGVTQVRSFTQNQRDMIGTNIMRLCLREMAEFHFMQTDPNWTNFLYNSHINKLVLLDFGASREYPERFINLYIDLLSAASRSDRDTVLDLSAQLGYLTGHESKAMLDAHVTSVLTLAEPFTTTAPEVYDFKDQTITERVKAQIPVMIRERLAPPPEETYSLHRKLSGAFLLCSRLGSKVRCREMFQDAMEKRQLAM